MNIIEVHILSLDQCAEYELVGFKINEKTIITMSINVVLVSLLLTLNTF